MATERISLIEPATKECPFCAEVIQARAVKCRYCGEFLNTRRARRMFRGPVEDDTDTEPLEDETTEQDDDGDEILFEATPSLFGMFGAFVKAAAAVAAAVAVVVYPVEQWMDKWFSMGVSAERLAALGRYRLTAGLGLAVLATTFVVIKALKLRMTRYEITVDRIEWARGIFDRRVDNLDMFRVLDLKLYRNLFDCLVGIGTVELTTNDQSDPDFVFEKLRRPRQLYDIIKKASLEADRRNNVVHLES